MDLDPSLPTRLGRYQLLSVLGEGGMGRVYRAELTGPSGFRKAVALKVVLAHGDADEDERRAEFEHEARLGGLLRHPNVVDVYDFGFADGSPWLAMELVDGWTLDALLRNGPLPPTVVCALGAAIADALDHAHALRVDGAPNGLVHRDLKPPNVLVGRLGQVKVTDFGIAAAAGPATVGESGTVRGTPAYMSPEQARGAELDGRSDLFALGSLLYAMATGEPLFGGPNLLAVMLSVIGVEEVREDAARRVEQAVPGLGSIVFRCLAEAADERHDRGADLAAALRAAAVRLPPGPTVRGWVHAWQTGTVAVVGVADAGLPTLADAAIASLDEAFFDPAPPAFVGRGEELDALRLALLDTRPVVLVGPAGCGKTRSAAEIAGGWAGSAAQVDLFDAGGLADVVEAVARTLGVDLAASASSEDAAQRLGHAIAARGAMLLTLDDADAWIDGLPGLLRRWSKAAPAARFLVTSRSRPKAPSVRVLAMGPLPPDDALRLFAARVEEARRRPLEPEELPTARGLVAALDGIPLALELAAARSEVLSLERLAKRLADRFAVLQGRSGRHLGLRAAIDASWELLNPAERAVLAACSVFRGGFPLEGAEAVATLPDGGWVMDVVGTLRDKSLLRLVRAAGPTHEARFGFLESIRAYAAERLAEADDGGAVRKRHTEWGLAVGEEAAEAVLGTDGARALAQLADERENLAAIFERHREGAPALAARAALALAPLVALRGPTELRARLLSARLPEDADAGLRIDLALERARWHDRAGKPDDALREALGALTLARDHGDRGRETRAACLAAGQSALRGRLDEAQELAEGAFALAKALGEPRLSMAAHEALGTVFSHTERSAEGMDHILDAGRLAQTIGDRRNAARLLGRLAAQHGNRGRVDLAAQLWGQSLSELEAIGDTAGAAVVRGNVATVALMYRRHDEAEDAFQRARHDLALAGDARGSAMFLYRLAELSFVRGRTTEALERSRESLVRFETLDAPAYHGLAVRTRAMALAALGRLDEAEAAHRASLALLAKDSFGRLVQAGEALLAATLADLGRIDEAAELLAKARAGTTASKTPEGRAYMALCEAHIELARGRAARDAGDDAGWTKHRRAVQDVHRRYGYRDGADRRSMHPASNQLARAGLRAAMDRAG